MCGFSPWNTCWPSVCCQPVCCQPAACPGPINLGGTVTGVGGAVPNLPIAFTINGVAASTTTDVNGRYAIIAPRCTTVVITPQPGLGVTVTPPSLTVTANQDRADLNFVLAPLV